MKPRQMFVTTIQIGSLIVGWLIIAASIPLAFIGGAAPIDTVPTWSPLVVVPLGACVLASGFLYIGVFGKNLTKSRAHRVFAALLLVMPLIAGMKLLLTPDNQGLHPFGFFLFVPACILFFGAIWAFCSTQTADSTPLA
jgi:hypothetical protein